MLFISIVYDYQGLFSRNKKVKIRIKNKRKRVKIKESVYM